MFFPPAGKNISLGDAFSRGFFQEGPVKSFSLLERTHSGGFGEFIA
jgi:hypothetical protein